MVDHASAGMSLDVFYKALRSLPNKYNNGRLRWIMSPHRQQEWERYILDKAVTVGGIISDRRVENPCSIPAIAAPAMPDDKLLLVDPKNLIVVNTYDMKIRKTTEGKDAVMQDKRFYVVHLDFDPAEAGFTLAEETEFPGSSHERIIRKIYEREADHGEEET